MPYKFLIPSLLVSILLSFVFISQCTTPGQNQSSNQNTSTQQEAPVPELAEYMGNMQHYTHKFALAVDAGNQELSQFYFHEIRALSDEIKKDIPGYEGYDIARFMGIFFDPTIQPIETALGNNDMEEARAQVLELVEACNSCHNATGHGFVQVSPGFDKNPYNQDFSAPE